MHTKRIVPHRYNDRDITMRRTRAGRGCATVASQQGARQLALTSSRTLRRPSDAGPGRREPAAQRVGDPRAGPIRRRAHARRRSTARRTRRQPRLSHVSIPSGPGVHRATRQHQSSTISAKILLPSAAVAVVGVPNHSYPADGPDSTVAASTATARAAGTVSGEPSVGEHIGR